MPREEDPQFPHRDGLVIAAFPGADAETVERLVVEPLEEALSEVEAVGNLYSTARAGVAILHIRMQETAYDTDKAWDEIEDAVNKARREVPGRGLPARDQRRPGVAGRGGAGHPRLGRSAGADGGRPHAQARPDRGRFGEEGQLRRRSRRADHHRARRRRRPPPRHRRPLARSPAGRPQRAHPRRGDPPGRQNRQPAAAEPSSARSTRSAPPRWCCPPALRCRWALSPRSARARPSRRRSACAGTASRRWRSAWCRRTASTGCASARRCAPRWPSWRPASPRSRSTR